MVPTSKSAPLTFCLLSKKGRLDFLECKSFASHCEGGRGRMAPTVRQTFN